MVYTWEDIVRTEGGITKANKMIQKKKYKKVSHGVYVDDGEEISELEQLFVRYPRATLTLQSAFDYYELSDFIPDKYYIVTPYNCHTIQNDKVYQLYMKEEIVEIGRKKISTKYGHIFIFDIERMLVELFRLKIKLPRDYFLEVVSSYRLLKSKDAISLKKVSEYCMKIPQGQRLLKEIQDMI